MDAQKTCLIIDDSSVIREIAMRIIEDLGLKAAQAETAVEALAICAGETVDAALLDWDLPSMGALDFLRGAAELEPDKRPEIVLCATENDPQQFSLAKAAGAPHHILKPFDKSTVAVTLSKIGLSDAAPEDAQSAAAR